jgi:hypothetical protein
MPEGVDFPFPSLLFHEGRTYGQPEVVRISLPQVATGLRLCLPGSFRRRGFQPDLLMPQEALFARGAHSMQAVMHRALLRRGRSGRYPKLIGFLKRQEANGKFFSKAMQKEPVANTEEV